MRLLRVLTVVACFVVALSMPHGAAAAKKCRRMRKPWTSYSQEEKDVYLRAVGLGMEKGYYALFTKVHANEMSSAQAHNTCGFLLWHRRLLLAYENMLRSFGPEFECVTIPVWNVFGEYAMQTQKKCRSIEECSPLLQALGGSAGVDKTLRIESRKFGPNCVENGPVGKYCDGPDMDPAHCTRCIPRGNWASQALPDSLSYSSLIRTLADATGAKDLNQNVQHSAHDHVHSSLKGVMASFYSPLDPVFYSLHTTMDMLHHMYYTCNIGSYLSDDEKKSLPQAWQSCAMADGPENDATSEIVMKYFKGEEEVSVVVDDHLKPFYEGVPNTFYELVDASDIGDNSYGYRMTSLLTDLMFNTGNSFKCSTHGRRRLMAQEEEPTAEGVGFSVIDEGNQTAPATVVPPEGESGADAANAEAMGATTGIEDQDEAQSDEGAAEKTTADFYYKALELARMQGESDEAAREEVEIMECKIHNETMSRVEDFSPEFRFEFNIPEDKYPRCYELLVVNKKVEIKVADWRALAEDEFKVTLAKPADPNVPVSELDSAHGAEIAVTTTEVIITPAPDVPVATAEAVTKEEVTIKKENAQTPPPTTAPPPTPAPEPSQEVEAVVTEAPVDETTTEAPTADEEAEPTPMPGLPSEEGATESPVMSGDAVMDEDVSDPDSTSLLSFDSVMVAGTALSEDKGDAALGEEESMMDKNGNDGSAGGATDTSGVIFSFDSIMDEGMMDAASSGDDTADASVINDEDDLIEDIAPTTGSAGTETDSKSVISVDEHLKGEPTDDGLVSDTQDLGASTGFSFDDIGDRLTSDSSSNAEGGAADGITGETDSEGSGAGFSFGAVMDEFTGDGSSDDLVETEEGSGTRISNDDVVNMVTDDTSSADGEAVDEETDGEGAFSFGSVVDVFNDDGSNEDGIDVDAGGSEDSGLSIGGVVDIITGDDTSEIDDEVEGSDSDVLLDAAEDDFLSTDLNDGSTNTNSGEDDDTDDSAFSFDSVMDSISGNDVSGSEDDFIEEEAIMSSGEEEAGFLSSVVKSVTGGKSSEADDETGSEEGFFDSIKRKFTDDESDEDEGEDDGEDGSGVGFISSIKTKLMGNDEEEEEDGSGGVFGSILDTVWDDEDSDELEMNASDEDEDSDVDAFTETEVDEEDDDFAEINEEDDEFGDIDEEEDGFDDIDEEDSASDLTFVSTTLTRSLREQSDEVNSRQLRAGSSQGSLMSTLRAFLGL